MYVQEILALTDDCEICDAYIKGTTDPFVGNYGGLFSLAGVHLM